MSLPLVTAPAPAVGGVRASRLAGDPEAYLAALPELGPVVLRAESEAASLAVTAPFDAPLWCGRHLCLPGDGAELRVGPGRLAAAFLLAEGRPDRRREGLRFLDVSGEVSLAAELTSGSERAALHHLAARAPQGPGPTEGWGMPDSGAVTEGALAAAVDPNLVSELLATVADAGIPVRLILPGAGLWLTAATLLGDPVCRADRIALHGAGVRLDLAADALCRVEVRRLAVPDGLAHSVELFDADGQRILRLMGQGVPGCPEERAWRTLVGGLLPAESA